MLKKVLKFVKIKKERDKKMKQNESDWTKDKNGNLEKIGSVYRVKIKKFQHIWLLEFNTVGEEIKTRVFDTKKDAITFGNKLAETNSKI
jgi:hypothetical protein